MYRIGEAASRSGVSVPLLRAWERRYGVVAPQRTAAGYRLYDDEAIARLRAVRSLVESGWAARQAAAHVAGLTGEMLARPAPVPDAGRHAGEIEGVATNALVRRFTDAARRVDPDGADRALDEAYAAASFETATERVVLPALVAIGEAWSRGELDVAAEHVASSAVLRRMGAAFDAAGRATGAPVVLVGMPAGARHEIAALAVATAARRVGIDAIYLGPDVPAASWEQAIAETGARGVVTGAVMEADARAATAALTRLRRQRPPVVLMVGGTRAGAISVRGIVRLPDGIEAAARAIREAVAVEARPGRRPGPRSA
jgi:methanogenic corrinoid protein MtbC1